MEKAITHNQRRNEMVGNYRTKGCAGIDKEVVAEQLRRLLADIEREISRSQGISSYRRIPVGTDFSIHLVHDTTEIETCGSGLGLRIVEALKELGMVNHTIWQESSCG